MSQELLMQIGRETLTTMLMLAAPMLLAGLTVGVLVSLLQSVTQIQEMTLTFIPKIVAVVVALLICLPWMVHLIMRFFGNLVYHVGHIGR